MRPLPAAKPRFRVVRELGAGGMGSVDLVWDERRQEEVARKRCRIGAAGPSDSNPTQKRRAFSLLKREFRSASELSHPALVRVFELGEDSDGVYFTMEAIEGVDLFGYCRRSSDSNEHGLGVITPADALAATLTSSPADALGNSTAHDGSVSVFDRERLASVLPSILAGLSYLHARGLVHRDLKPSNILVDGEGRPRIVDFGILAELAAPPGEMAGTPAFMAPEQIRGAPPTPAMDLYALGVTLFELVAGVLPFTAETTVGMFGQHLTKAPPRLSESVREVPPGLDEAVLALLAKEPTDRPTIAALASSLLPMWNVAMPRLETVSLVAGELVGRELMQLRIVDLLDRASQFGGLVLEGPSGVGKTALARWASEHARSARWSVLEGRARPNELVPFNAIDGLVEDLSSALSTIESDSESIAADRLRASVAFPALGRGLESKLDPNTAREVAFEGVIGLVSSLAQANRGVLIVIDDLQWADTDSLLFLEAITLATPQKVKLIATFRDDLPVPAHTAWIDRQSRLQRSPVPPLDVNALAMIASRSAADTLDADAARRIAEGCAGRAYLAEVAGRLSSQSGAPPSHLTEALAERLAAMPEPETMVISALAAAEGWLDSGDLAAALSMTVGEVDRIARGLSELAVVRRTGRVGQAELIDLYHDVARVAALEAVGDEGLRAGHGALADLLASRPGGDPLLLVRHLSGAGRAIDAAMRAEAEAGRAERQRAYGLAADLYAIAAAGIEGRKNALGRKRSAALIRAGLYERAVAQIDALSPQSDQEHAELAFDRGYALLMAGSTLEAKRSLDETLVRQGLSRLGRSGVTMAWEYFRVWLGPPKPSRRRENTGIDSLTSERGDREAEVVLILTWEDPVAAVSWAHRMRTRADRDGRPERGAFADYALAFFNVATRPTAAEPPLVAKYLASARLRVGVSETADEPYLASLDLAVEAFLALRQGRFAESARGFSATARSLEHAGRARSYLHLLALANVCGAYMCGERVRELGRTIDALDIACPPEQGTMAHQTVVLRASLAAYESDRLEYFDCRERLRARETASDEFYFHHLVAEVMGSCGELYFGDPRVVRLSNAAAMRRGRKFLPMTTYFAGGFSSFLALHEAAALRMGDTDASPRRIARWAKIARKAPPVFSTGAIRAEAYATDHAGRPERAVKLLREAERLADAFDLPVSRGIARYQLGTRLGGDGGAELIAASRADMRSVGASEHTVHEDRGLWE